MSDQQMTLKQALGTPPKMIAAGVWFFLTFAMTPLLVAVAARVAVVTGGSDAGIWNTIVSGAVFQDATLMAMLAATLVGEILFFGLPFYLGKDVVKLLKQKTDGLFKKKSKDAEKTADA
ncbi:hypothetical protein [Paraferrimonas sedimenticola]|uniref:Uncharacterized protein n=1 Tax=Paraferrimonas sedimenticola TaxID=375674 RepID=A0AA37W1M1_9GAMM|nr:hypothetical protein [Paraferrimonas sedimenticola]GLP96417.1 hypothetical protein GCM10007895_17230 [Paraferrimonas sedimenticola]